MFACVALGQETVETVAGKRALGYKGLGPNPVYTDEVFPTEDLPKSFDWRSAQAVPSIKNQGQCGSCWAFAITKSLEAALIVQTGLEEQNLSEQQMVSCDRSASGCSGGYMTSAQYVVDKGLTGEDSFPYAARNLRCKAVTIEQKAASYKLLGSRNKKPTVEEIKAAMVKYGPVFVTVAAGGSGWSGRTGEITGCRNRGTNHMVNLVGWTENGKWIVANSWSESWGDKGFTLMKFGCDKIGEEAGYIVVQ